MYDVAIVGAGPAGSAAALKLKESGVNVIILEKEKFPRYKTCGGGVVYRARKILGVDIAKVVEREFSSATMNLLLENLSFVARSDKPMISMTSRASLDNLLLGAAQNAGAEIREGIRVLSVSAGNNKVALRTTYGPVKAKYVIAADGVNSVVAKSAGWEETRTLAPAIEEELYLPDKDMALHADQARFDLGIPTHGYAWLFPKNDHLSAGVLSVRPGKVGLISRFSQYVKTIGIRNIRKKEHHAGVIPLAPRKDGFVRHRVLLAGDSAGLADPLTAEGIYSAVRSGHMAAGALLASDFDADRTAILYEKALRQTLLPELTAAGILAKVLYGSPRLRTWVFRRYGDRFTHAVRDIILGERTYHKEILNPRNYLRLFR